ncbi:SRPBCC family protein [Halosolutus amylolyticus]|uniref:SRPBCC family protein n=1 Tax=Halosolutus amylolyticus TaxID=2932267 RepID=A0ABD5PSS4_9EURY|nr:SRPBCC domain-containing protein [Halosolutus amylolyticus]
MNQVEVFEEIDAPPDVVWDVLLDFEAYPSWNPFIRSIEGEPVPGEQLRVRIDPPESRAFTFKPEVIFVEENRRLVWLGRLGVPFAFDGYHEFHLEPIGGGESSGARQTSEDRGSSGSEYSWSERDSDGATRTRLLQRETVRGALVPLLFDRDEIARGFRAMNEALKERAEARVVA